MVRSNLIADARMGVTLGVIALLSPAANAQFLQLDFSVAWQWRYDVGAGQFDPVFTPFTMPLTVFVDPVFLGSTTLGASTRQSFGPVVFASPFSSMVDMGVDVTAGGFATIESRGFVQDTYISDTNQGTWTDLFQAIATPVGTYSYSLQYSADPRLANPASFGSAEYFAHLTDHVGVVFSFREDVVGGGDGWQNMGNATLVAATPITQIPEPASVAVILAGISGLVAFGRRVAVARG